MTEDQIGAILDRVRTWPLERQEDAATLLLRLEEDGKRLIELNDEERRAIEESRQQTQRGEFVADHVVERLLARYRK